jgi:hypothetical protein
MSISDSNVTTNQILRWFDGGLAQESQRMRIQITNMGCRDLFDHYAKTLVAGR